jgi:LysR family hydrogen peroxide-inducible transcriptional activator
MQIGQMERQLGVILVERRSTGIALTAAGREVARRAADILAELRALAEFAASCRAPLSTPIRLGVIPTIAPYLLPGLLPRLRERCPDLVVQIRETQTHALVSELLAADLDLLVVALPIEHPDIETLPVRTDRFLLAVPAGDPGYPQAPVSPERLRDERLLLLEEGHCFRDQALAVCTPRPLSGADVLGASSLSTIVQMVAGGFGVTLLPEIGAACESADRGVRLVRFTEPQPERILGIAWRRSSPRKAEFKLLGTLIEDVWGGAAAAGASSRTAG